MDHTLNGNGFAQEVSQARWAEAIGGAMRGPKIGPAALVLLIVGLMFAIATDGNLPVVWSRALFALLFVSNLVVTNWLIRGAHSPNSRQ
jgi:hypothetical protein